jgi:plastocyanin
MIFRQHIHRAERRLLGALTGLLLVGLLTLLAACGSSTTSTGSASTPTAAASTPAATSSGDNGGYGNGKYGNGSTPTAAAATSTPASSGSGGDAVSIASFSFSPNTLSVKVGTKVTWTNNDSVPHTVTANDGSFNSNTLPPGQSFSFTFTKAGAFAYHCNIHTTMKATITVQ